MFSVVKVNKKPRPRRGLMLYSKTEREGFEPSKPCGLQVFETCCFNHSHTSPKGFLSSIIPKKHVPHTVNRNATQFSCSLFPLVCGSHSLQGGSARLIFSYPLLPLCGGGWNSRRTSPYAGKVEILALWRAG